MRWEDNVRSIGLPVGIRRRASRPSLAARAARAVDVIITRVQEWLERPDSLRAKAGAYVAIGTFLLILVVEIWRVITR